LLTLAIGAVWTAEAFNSSIEFLVDLVHPEWHEHAGRIKDLSAGAVLLISIASAVIGILIFGSKLYDLGYLPHLW
jgi:diacylglycerol kinase (ATP)